MRNLALNNMEPDIKVQAHTAGAAKAIKGSGEPMAEGASKIKKPSKIFTDYYGSLFLLLIAVYVVLGFFVIKPKIDANKDLNYQIMSTQQTSDNDRLYFDSLSRSVAAAKSIDSEVLKKVDLALPRTAGIPDLLVQLSAAAELNGVALSNVVFENSSEAVATQTAGEVKIVNATLTVTAKDYVTLKKFLSTLETSLRIFDVQTVTISGFGEDGVSFSVQLKSYYYPPTN